MAHRPNRPAVSFEERGGHRAGQREQAQCSRRGHGFAGAGFIIKPKRATSFVETPSIVDALPVIDALRARRLHMIENLGDVVPRDTRRGHPRGRPDAANHRVHVSAGVPLVTGADDVVPVHVPAEVDLERARDRGRRLLRAIAQRGDAPHESNAARRLD